MASFSFRGNAIGQNATTIVIDDVNDLNTAKQMAEARYPGWSITQGTKMGGGSIPSPVSNNNYTGSSVSQPQSSRNTSSTVSNDRYKVDYTRPRVSQPQPQSSGKTSSSYSNDDNAFDQFMMNGMLWLGGKLISMTWNFTTDVLRVLLRWSLITFRNLLSVTTKVVVFTSNVTQNASVYCENKLNENWHF